MTKDEALKLALEALDIGLDYARDEQFENARRYAGHERLAPDDAFFVKQIEDAITAIKEALSQPEHDWKAEYIKQVDLHNQTLDELREALAQPEQKVTSNEQLKPWQWLTADEIRSITKWTDNFRHGTWRMEFARALQQKVKEKNT